jgi:hypothetical protein
VIGRACHAVISNACHFLDEARSFPFAGHIGAPPLGREQNGNSRPPSPVAVNALCGFPCDLSGYIAGNHFADKDSRQINMLEQLLIAKVFNFGGICFNDGTL